MTSTSLQPISRPTWTDWLLRFLEFSTSKPTYSRRVKRKPLPIFQKFRNTFSSGSWNL